MDLEKSHQGCPGLLPDTVGSELSVVVTQEETGSMCCVPASCGHYILCL